MKLVFLIILFVAGAVIAAGPKVCNECSRGPDKASCLASQDTDQVCANDSFSLGTTHCASAEITYQTHDGKIFDSFRRGCFDCANKKEACFALGGFLKSDKRFILLQCAIECCTTDNCNTQAPTLSKDAITVFTPNASGPAECNSCLPYSGTECSKNLKEQKCGNDSASLGTTHCGYAAIRKARKDSGRVTDGFFRGCINCADKKAACAAIGGFVNEKFQEFVLQCDIIECCTGNNCNTPVPTLPPTGTGHPVFFGGVLAFVLTFCNILYHFY